MIAIMLISLINYFNAFFNQEVFALRITISTPFALNMIGIHCGILYQYMKDGFSLLSFKTIKRKNEKGLGPGYAIKNKIINEIKEFLPGFGYFIDFEWDTEQDNNHYDVGDLIFG